MKKAGLGLWILAAALLLAAFSAGFYFGRRSVPYELSAETERTVSSQKAAQGAERSAAQTASSAAPSLAPGEKVNLNTATSEQLQLLPGIGEVLAGRILEYRSAYGKFSAVEQLMDVEGIGEAKFAALRDQITVEDSDENTGS